MSPWNLNTCVDLLHPHVLVCVCVCLEEFNYVTAHTCIYILCALWYICFSVLVAEHVLHCVTNVLSHEWHFAPGPTLCDS